MTNKPLSAEDLLESFRDDLWGRYNRILLGSEPGMSVEQLKSEVHAKAKRHLAEAIQHIIGEDQAYRNLGGDFPGAKECNRLRAEQRKRLAEWLGEETK